MKTAAAPAPAPAEAAPPIQVDGLVSRFGDNVVHDDLNLTVERGEVLGVVGGSGTGKSVLLNSIIGLKAPDGGVIRLFGEDMQEASRRSAGNSMHSSNCIWMSDPSRHWISIERSGVSMCREPSRCDWNNAPSSVILRIFDRLMIMNSTPEMNTAPSAISQL